MSFQVLDGGKPEIKVREKSEFEKYMYQTTAANLKCHVGISLKSSRKIRELVKDYERDDSVEAIEVASFIAQVHAMASYCAHQIIVRMSEDNTFDLNQNAINLLMMELLSMKDKQINVIKGTTVI